VDADHSDIVENEFATVTISIDRTGNDTRLLIVDNASGRATLLDALVLEALVWTPPDALRTLLDPSLHRWSDAPHDPQDQS